MGPNTQARNAGNWIENNLPQSPTSALASLGEDCGTELVLD